MGEGKEEEGVSRSRSGVEWRKMRCMIKVAGAMKVWGDYQGGSTSHGVRRTRVRTRMR